MVTFSSRHHAKSSEEDQLRQRAEESRASFDAIAQQRLQSTAIFSGRLDVYL
ncbi:hypothetical protein [Dactylosporangium sp. NPDC049140]|uniref:hypothetical protein n=1 Tax=Dactylosporangium sp. NPDC049140 TaxID=3155647 RepID=UPI0034002CF2